jgi:hypothetical protein
MLESIVTFVVAIAVAVAWDWIGAGRLAAYSTDFDYRYWPLTTRRKVGLAALILCAISVWGFTGSHSSSWTFVIPVALFAVWGITAIVEIRAQKRTAYRTPPRYSEGEYGS